MPGTFFSLSPPLSPLSSSFSPYSFSPPPLLSISSLTVANGLHIVPLALAAPAVAASIAYLDAKTGISYDYRTIGSGIKSRFVTSIKEKNDRLSMFYVLEGHALGRSANQTFLIFEGRKWTYKETYQTTLRYGRWLKTKYGVKPKQVVAIDFMNSDKLIFIWFGLWSIGAKPAFINYNLAGKALAHCVRVSTASVLLLDPQVQEKVTQDVRDELPDVRFELFSPELESEVLATEPIREPNSARSEDKAHNMAKLVFTSGTTGLPKPAIVSWSKIILATRLVPDWASLRRSDIYYTVRPTPLPLFV
jgi:acyl-CoA synthetase (AMP-forming)/AMP-acid ligase II